MNSPFGGDPIARAAGLRASASMLEDLENDLQSQFDSIRRGDGDSPVERAQIAAMRSQIAFILMNVRQQRQDKEREAEFAEHMAEHPPQAFTPVALPAGVPMGETRWSCSDCGAEGKISHPADVQLWALIQRIGSHHCNGKDIGAVMVELLLKPLPTPQVDAEFVDG